MGRIAEPQAAIPEIFLYLVFAIDVGKGFGDAMDPCFDISVALNLVGWNCRSTLPNRGRAELPLRPNIGMERRLTTPPHTRPAQSGSVYF